MILKPNVLIKQKDKITQLKIIYKKGAKELNMIEKRLCDFMIHQLGP